MLPLSPQASHNLGLALLSGLQALMPWHYALKRIGGRFGSSVLSYFLFLKTLLAFNTLLLLPLLAFIVGVQAAFPPAPTGPVPAFTGLELLTGGVRLGGEGAASRGTLSLHPHPNSCCGSGSLAFPGTLEALGQPRSSVHLRVPLTPLALWPFPFCLSPRTTFGVPCKPEGGSAARRADSLTLPGVFSAGLPHPQCHVLRLLQ